jgi:hypothetical protein
MSYSFDLIHLPSNVDRKAAYRSALEAAESFVLDDDPGPIDPAREKAKAVLAQALIAAYPSLRPFERNYARLAERLSLDEAEARRLHRNIELNNEARTIQITLFDDTAGLSFSPDGSAAECRAQLQHVWDCLKIMQAQAEFSIVDAQLGRVLDLSSDFEDVLQQTCPPQS